MTEYFSAQLDRQRTEQETAGRRVIVFDDHVNRIEPEAPTLPAHLASYILEALRLDRLRNGGARFAYPEGLMPVEWAAMDALQAARMEDQAKADETRQQKVSEDSERSRLDALRRRGR